MKPTLAFAALALLATAAAAEPGSIASCTSLSEAAQSAMMVRQSGLPIYSVMNQLAGSLDGTDLQLAILMMEAAYERPLFSSDEYKVQAANEFASDVFRLCRED